MATDNDGGRGWAPGGHCGEPEVSDSLKTFGAVLKALRDEEGWLPAFLPTADGLVCAVRR